MNKQLGNLHLMNNLSQLKDYQTFKSVIGKITEEEIIQLPVVTLCTDTRAYDGETAFLAITGERFNGFEFIQVPVKKGCKIIIFTDHDSNKSLLENYLNKYPDLTFIKVSNSITFLQEHARNVAKKFQASGKKLICISGSNGKTTTKEMLYSLLAELGFRVIKTQKNNNNHIGVPLTLLQISKSTEYAVVELGSNHPGEIKALCEIAEPNIGVVTNIGLTHMEFFPELSDVFKEEGFLYHHIVNKNSKQKIFFQNLDDNFLKKLPNSSDTVGFGKNHGEYQFNVDSISGMISFQGANYEVNNSNITGKHNFYNLCLSIAIAHKVSGLDLKKICKAAEKFQPTKNRSQWLELKGKKVFLDAYNANPSSMEVALNAFQDHLDKNNISYHDACVILGDMNELGAKSAEYHKLLGQFVMEKKFGGTIFVGRYAKDYISNSEFSENIKTFETTEELADFFQSKVVMDYKYIFIKGSRSLQLEALVDIT
jgi:UDP-N-acetylmuramoyl-tripeptide--D-alanyl-D-alanine ligase